MSLFRVKPLERLLGDVEPGARSLKRSLGAVQLTALGIGNYAPCLALVSLLGMNPKAAFPIMMGSAALILPVAALQFHASRRYHRRIALGLTLGGVPGVLVAAFLVRELPLDAVRWMVVGVLVVTSAMLLRSARTPAVSGETPHA